MSEIDNEINREIDADAEINFHPLSEGLGFKSNKPSSKTSKREQSSSLASRNFLNPHGEEALSLKTQRALENNSMESQTSEHQESLQSSNPVQESSSEENLFSPSLGRPKSRRQESWAGDIDLGGGPPVDGVVEEVPDVGSTVIDNPFFTPSKPISPVEVVTLKFSGHDGLQKKPARPGLFSLMAIFMDVLTLISLIMISSTVYFGSTSYGLSEFLFQLPYNPAFKAQVIGVTLSLGFLYLVLSRCFFGRTIGEWMFRLQLGSSEDQEKATYPVRVLIRSFFILISGFLVFPIFSLLFRKDLLFYLSGLSLYGEDNS